MAGHCVISGCDGASKCRGMCQAHYCRWLRTGDAGSAVVQRRRRALTGRIPGYKRDYHLRTTYGISYEEYQKRLAAQGGGCAICGGMDSGNSKSERLPVDHCHETGAVRGILCGPCNKGLGHLGDDPARLMSAVAYLLQHTNLLDVARRS
jgi:hypothetical protein